MLPVYIFCLVLGGGLLLLSLLGDVFADAGGDLDLDVSGDVSFELDGAEIDSSGVDIGDGGMDADGGDASHASRILSIRTLTYVLFGFGAVGTLMGLFGSAGFATTLGLALTGGFLAGALVTSAFRYLETTDTGAQLPDMSFVGLSGTVTIPISEGSAGAVAVQRGQRRISLRALPHESARDLDPTDWTSVVVVEMEDGVARVAPVGDDLALDP
jgi:hypothetical protein